MVYSIGLIHAYTDRTLSPLLANANLTRRRNKIYPTICFGRRKNEKNDVSIWKDVEILWTK